MSASVPHEEIRDKEDRGWTFRLLDLVRSSETPEPELGEAFDTLGRLEDFRSIVPLTEMVDDRRLPEGLRRAASAAVANFDGTTTEVQRRAWWAGDSVQQAHALVLMERPEADIVEAVALDDRHRLQARALSTLTWGFEEPRFQPPKIRALGHPDPEVRRMAASALHWDEPVAAEEALLAATGDASEVVVLEATDTLRYYKSRRVLRALSDLANSEHEAISAAATVSFDSLRDDFEMHTVRSGDPQEHELLAQWLEPVADLVSWSDPAERPSYPTSVRDGSSAAELLLAMIEELDGEWAAKKMALSGLRWSDYSSSDRERLTEPLSMHPDPEVRSKAAGALAVWDETERLLAMLTDPDSNVRKSAAYYLGEVPRSEMVAPAAWHYLTTAWGTTATESLRTYVVHAPADEAKRCLVDLALDDPRESVRAHAVSHLVDLRAREELASMTPLLTDPPGVTWAVHIAVLDGLHELALGPPDLSHLLDVDNLDLMESVFPLLI